MAGDPADLAALRAQPANGGLLEWLARDAAPGDPASPYALDAYVTRSHPDLTERLDELAAGLPGGRSSGVYGVSALVVGDVVAALALGTSGLYLRVGEPAIVAEMTADGGAAAPDLGPGWWRVDPWLANVPRAEGTARLRRWLATAAEEAAGA